MFWGIEFGIHGFANEWFKSISQIENNVSINGYDSNLADVKFVVPQGSALGLLLFLVYMNESPSLYRWHKLNSF